MKHRSVIYCTLRYFDYSPRMQMRSCAAAKLEPEIVCDHIDFNLIVGGNLQQRRQRKLFCFYCFKGEKII